MYLKFKGIFTSRKLSFKVQYCSEWKVLNSLQLGDDCMQPSFIEKILKIASFTERFPRFFKLSIACWTWMKNWKSPPAHESTQQNKIKWKLNGWKITGENAFLKFNPIVSRRIQFLLFSLYEKPRYSTYDSHSTLLNFNFSSSTFILSNTMTTETLECSSVGWQNSAGTRTKKWRNSPRSLTLHPMFHSVTSTRTCFLLQFIFPFDIFVLWIIIFRLPRFNFFRWEADENV